MTTLGLACVLLAAWTVGCASSNHSITVYAAASLRDAFTELAATYTAETRIDVITSFDASSALRTQIEEGAPADVFASADLINADSLVDAGLTNGPSQVFAGNALTIVVPSDNPAGIDAWSAIGDSGVRIVAAGEDVPITRYAVDLVDRLAARSDAPDEFADAYAANVVSREDNVRSVLAKIEIGEGDVAIVYETDARATVDVTTVPVPPDSNVVAEYGVVLIDEAGPDADEFVTWLLGDRAQAILADHGFRPPS